MTHFTNPILPGYYPDPSVLRVGDTFYLVNSSFEHFPGLPIHKSTDLAHWELVTHAITRPDQLDYTNIRPSGGIYAPTLREHNGIFYIACTFVDGPAGNQGNFLISAPSPEGPWSDPIFVDFPGIDPSLFFEDGRAWWMGCDDAAPSLYEGHKSTWLQEVELSSGSLIGPRHQLWSGALRNAVWSEGPHIYKVDGWYYLLAAEAGTEFNHAVSVARSRNLTGPYIGNPRNPVLTHRHLGSGSPVQNVGHAEIFDDSAGNWWAVTLGTRPVNGLHILGRETFLTPVTWEDGWPVFSPGLGQLPEEGETGLLCECAHEDQQAAPQIDVLAHAIETAQSGNVERSNVLSLRDNWLNHVTVDENAILSILPSNSNLDSTEPHAFLGYRLQSNQTTICVELDLRNASGLTPSEYEVPLSVGIEYGLALVQNNDHSIRAHIKTGSGNNWVLEIIERCGGTSSVRASTNIPSTNTELRIKARISEGKLHVSARCSNGSAEATLTTDTLATEVAGGFVGTIAGPFAQIVQEAQEDQSGTSTLQENRSEPSAPKLITISSWTIANH